MLGMIDEIKRYVAESTQEASDLEIIQAYMDLVGEAILNRDNKLSHLTSSAIILNPAMTKMLMVHHNIYNTWTWVGGHNDGNPSCFEVALKEAKEETGLVELTCMEECAQSIEILPVDAHVRKGQYVSAHLHLNVSYIFFADEDHEVSHKEDENSGVKWVPLTELDAYSKEPDMMEIYLKLIRKAKRKWGSHFGNV